MKGIFETKTFQKLDEALASQVDNIPDGFLFWVLILGILLALIFWGVRIWRIWKGPGSELIQKYKQNWEQSNIDSKQKSLILTLMDQVNKEIPSLHNENLVNDTVKRNEHAKKIIDMIIEQIPLCLKSMKNINHRCAVFTVDHDTPNTLKIYEGCGYSIEGKNKLRLEISNSVAGKVFTTGEYQYIEDVSKSKLFTPNPKATKKYFSLLCVPIKLNGNTVGVLSIDGSEKSCFNEDDIEYFKMFSNLIAIVFSIIGYDKYLEGVDVSEKVKDTG
jgi:putative methionine-R-sulfoxide reductase with GAF domain